MSNLEILMRESTDRHGDTFYVGSCQFPGSVNLEDAVFFVFHPIEGDPQSRPKIVISKKRSYEERQQFARSRDTRDFRDEDDGGPEITKYPGPKNRS